MPVRGFRPVGRRTGGFAGGGLASVLPATWREEPSAWSDQAEDAKADDEQEGRDQAYGPSDGPDVGA